MSIGPAQTPEGAEVAVEAWNLMAGLDWSALPLVVEMLGVEDVERLIRNLVTIREQRKEGG